MTTILMTEEYWMNSPFSIARHYGGVQAYGVSYIIVNSRGMDLVECTKEADKLGRDMAIEPREPCDLIDSRYKSQYKRLGRDEFIKALKAGCNTIADFKNWKGGNQ